MAHDTDVSSNPAAETPAEAQARRRHALTTVFDEKFVAGYMGPVAYLDNQVLESPAAITFYNRQFGFVSKVLQYEYQYRSWNGYDQALLDRYAELITKKLTNISQLLQNWKARFSKVLQTSGVQMDTTIYNNPLTTTVPIISGHARLYFMVLKDLDHVNLMAGAANLMGVIDSSQRAQGEFTCKKAVRAFDALLRNEVTHIYREATRLLNEQHGGGKPDAARRQVLEAQGSELKAFSDAMATDGQIDRSLNLEGADPAQLIEDVTAASTAVTKASTRKKAEATPENT